MNKIDVLELEKELNKLSNYINEYENNYLNLFNEMKNSSLLWSDDHSTIFYKKIDEELRNNNLLYENIKDNYKVKDYICRNYKLIGNKIYFDFDKANEIIKCYENIIDKLTYYLSLINDMDYTFYNSEELRMINEITNSFNIIIKKLEDSKEKVRNTIDKIKDIEDKVKEILSDMELVSISSFKTDNLYS